MSAHMRRTSPISARFTKAIFAALALAAVEFVITWVHAAMHLGIPDYWVTMPITWPANLLLHVVRGPINDSAVEWFLMAVMYFALALNWLVLIVIAQGIWRRLRSRAAPP